MDEQPNENRPNVPTWVWILGVFALILGLQLWLSGKFNGPEQISLLDAMNRVKSGQVDQIMLTGSRLRLAMGDGTELSTTIDPSSSVEESLSYFGVTQDVLADNGVELVVNDQSGWNTFISIILEVTVFLALVAVRPKT